VTSLPLNTIITGHVLDALATLPDNSIHCCVTSPPYFGLRAYGTEPQVWGGAPACPHTNWGDDGGRLDPGYHGGLVDGKARRKGQIGERALRHSLVAGGLFCQACGAWRGELGAEPTPEMYIGHLVAVFGEVRRVLRKDGTLWVIIADTYAQGGMSNPSSCSTLKGGKNRGAAGYQITRRATGNLKPKDLVGIPWLLAFALRADGWYLRQDNIWGKSNCMPESVTDRTTCAHEHVFHLAKSSSYAYDADAIREPMAEPGRVFAADTAAHKTGALTMQGNRTTGGLHDGRAQYGDPLRGRNKRNVWRVPTEPYPGPHFAVFPPALVEPCILAGTSPMACPSCGAPWRRQVMKMQSERKQRRAMPNPDRNDAGASCNATRLYNTSGWRPTCPCPSNDGSAKCVVLDPFMGVGTTGLVAVRHGRAYIGVELNPAYADEARKRIDAEAAQARWSFERGAIDVPQQLQLGGDMT